LEPRGIEGRGTSGGEAGRQKILVKIYLTTLPEDPFRGIESEG